MALAHHYRVPRSVVLGRVVRPGEAQWLPQDTDDALAWLAHLADRCDGCGQPRTESMATDDRGRPAHAWVSSSTVCEACAALEDEQARFTGPAAVGRRYWVVREEVAGG